MENHSARNRAHQLMHTEQRLVIQPGEPFDRTIAAHVQGEAAVPTESAPSTQSDSAATSPPTKRKRSTAAKRKPTASFRRAWEVNQQLYAEELQRLEAEADRLNRALAERADAAKRSAPFPAAPTEPNASGKARSQSLRINQGPQTVFPDAEADDTANLQAQAARISQLLVELDSAIREGSALPPSEAGTGSAPPAPSPNPLPGSPYFQPLQPLDADLNAASRSAVSDAAQTAAALRHLASRERSPSPAPSQPTARIPPHSAPQQPRTNLRPPTRKRPRWQRWLQVPQTPIDRIGDALVWLVAAVMVRVCARILLSAYPVLAPAIAVLMLVPAVICVYLALYVPRAGMLSFYRLFLLMLGLLLGGKF